jgi:hypothetical protein
MSATDSRPVSELFADALKQLSKLMGNAARKCLHEQISETGLHRVQWRHEGAQHFVEYLAARLRLRATIFLEVFNFEERPRPPSLGSHADATVEVRRC